MRRALLTTPALLTLALAAGASPADPLQPVPRRVDLFKNGLAYLELEVRLTDEREWVEAVLPAAPLHGSFAVAADPAALRVRELVAERVKVEKSAPALSLAELLRANVGQELRLMAHGEQLRGRLVAFPQPDPEAAAPSRRSAALAPAGGALLLLETENGTVGLAPGSVEVVSFAEGASVSAELVREVEEPRLRVRLEGAAAGEVFSIRYLVRGATWAPSYRIELGDGERARISAGTDVLNDLMDLEGVPAHLVSGFPNLRFQHVPGALGLTTDLEGFLRAVASEPGSDRARREQIQSQAVFSNVAFSSQGGLAATEAGGFAGEAAEDLFFTSLGSISLKKGARGHYPLFGAEVPCEQVFRWEVEDPFDQHGNYRFPEQEERPQEVWHSLRVTNTTQSPWTTAPVTVLRGGRLVGQDICFYTTAGGKTLVKVTKALDLRAEWNERETKRVRQAERLYGRDFDRITIEGQLYLESYKPAPATIEISKTVSGDVLETTHEPDIARLGRGLRRINPLNRLEWRVELPSREPLEIRYVYEALVRR